MEEQIIKLVNKAWDRFLAIPSEERLCKSRLSLEQHVDVMGSLMHNSDRDRWHPRFRLVLPPFLLSHRQTKVPSPGKTALSTTVTAALNARYAAVQPTASPIAAFVPMDGYHLTRAQLDAMSDPATAHARRGAEFTFDGAGFLRLVQALRAPVTGESPIVYAPSFDHAVKDPKENDIAVTPTQRIVVFEGNCECTLPPGSPPSGT